MKKYWLLTIFLIVFSANSFAETCPSMSEFKNNKASGWKVFDSDDGLPLSPEREAAFKKHAVEFALAEWVTINNKKSAIHCYYRDASGSDLEAYLAKESFMPKKTKSYWYEVSGSMHCAAGMLACEFEKNMGTKTQTQLAKR